MGTRIGMSLVGLTATLVLCGLALVHRTAWAQEVCTPIDPDYCVTRICGEGQGDCDPGQCAAGLTCVNDVGARYGLPAHYDVCEVQTTTGGPDPDYCVHNYCGIGDGDCDPGQCDEGTCVNDVGAEYGLPAHYDVCEAAVENADAELRKLLGTWRVTATSLRDGTVFPATYTFSTLVTGTQMVTEEEGVRMVTGTLEDQGEWPLQASLTGEGYEHPYLLTWRDGTFCYMEFIILTSPTRFRGESAPLFYLEEEECQAFTTTPFYRLEGVRISGPQ